MGCCARDKRSSRENGRATARPCPRPQGSRVRPAGALRGGASGRYSRGDRELFRPLVDALLTRDEFFVMSDFASYAACQERVAAAFVDEKRWNRMSLLNAARVGRFSSDRSIREYAAHVWNVAVPAGRAP